LLGLSCRIIDVLPQAGGQCAQLYPDKPIYDIPGLPRTTGQDLVRQLLEQIAPFDIPIELGQQVAQIESGPASDFVVRTTSAREYRASTLFIAAGVGAFVPRALALEGLDRLQGVHHAGETVLPSPTAPHVVVAGGDGLVIESLRHWLAQPVASLTLLHRRDKLDLEPQQADWLQTQIEAQRVRFVVGQPVGHQAEEGRLRALQIAPPDGETFGLPCDVLVQCLGLSPKLGPVSTWGLAMARRQIEVNTRDFGTSVPGIYAVGDINHYPGKRKLIACGFHEATLAAYGAAERLAGGPITLEYTTSSSRLQARLKVQP
jgi:thioredoxin reductase (NADPH)